MRYRSAARGDLYVALTLVTALVVAAAPLTARVVSNVDDLDTLFDRLKHAHSSAEATEIESRIEEIWGRSGSVRVDSLVGMSVVRTAHHDYDGALELLDSAVALAPRFAEGWNKRATVHYLRGDYAESLDDIDRTLALEHRHFGALAGRGMIYMAEGKAKEALRAFEAVLALDPNSPGVRAHVEMLRLRLGYREV